MTYLKLFYTGIGKRKTSVAKVFLQKGSGILLINNQNFETYSNNLNEEFKIITLPFFLLNLNLKYDIKILVKGGGIVAQIYAIRLAISKAICKINNEYKCILNKKLLLRQDSRIKERRKYGLKKARKASQYSKR